MRTPTKALVVSTAFLGISALSASAALVTTLVGDSGDGSVTSVGGTHTIFDNTVDGDIWDGGDKFTYLHEENRINQSFTATVRVVGQTEDASGSWGKSGVMVRSGLAPNDSNALSIVAAGIGSQVNVPSVGAHNPVPIRLSGRTQNDGEGGFEIAIQDGGVDIPNNTFPEGAPVNPTWLSLSWDSTTNEFIAGTAVDNAGAPGPWNYSAGNVNVPADPAGWYVGIGYSAHNSMALLASGEQGLHGVTFDNFTIDVVPEPSTSLLGLLALGFFGLRRRR